MIGYFLVEHSDYWEIPLTGKSVSRFVIDRRVTLNFLDPEDEETSIEIEADFKVKVNSEEFTLSPENRTSLGPVFELFNYTVESAVAFKNGKLEIKFVENATLTVLPTPEFESWQVIGVRGLRVVCTGGGQIFTWQADNSGLTGGDVH
jgi:hypothetical protein